MTYDYKCESEHITTLVQSIKDPTPKTVVCEVCGKEANRDWGAGSSVIIPESFKATSDVYNSDDLSNPKVLGRRLNHTRPSGKSKIYY